MNHAALNESLASLHPHPQPELAFIGNRTEVMIQFATYLYPQIMAAIEVFDKNKREKMAELLLREGRNNFRTVEIGPFKYSYASAIINGREVGVLGMRMPNGDLAGQATEALLKNNVKKIIMVGAGGALESTSHVGEYQIFEESSYLDQQAKIPKVQQVNIKLPASLAKKKQNNITVDSPLVENQAWLRKVGPQHLSSVDVETYHIVSAFRKHAKVGQKILCGIFNSDVVGEHPLVEKIDPSNAWVRLPNIISAVFDDTFKSE